MNDRSWLAQFFESQAPALRRFLRRYGSEALAEDLVQESFARMCAADLTEVHSPRSYLFRTARNLALNELRRERVSKIDPLPPPALNEIAAQTPTPEDQTISAHELAGLNEALDSLPPKLRTALVLFRIEGLSHREIGIVLGVSHRSVERYVAQALSHCQVFLSSRSGGD